MSNVDIIFRDYSYDDECDDTITLYSAYPVTEGSTNSVALMDLYIEIDVYGADMSGLSSEDFQLIRRYAKLCKN